MAEEDDNADEEAAVVATPAHPFPPPPQMSAREFDAFTLAIGGLPADCRKAFTLWMVYRYSDEELAKKCGVSVQTVVEHVKEGCTLLDMHSESKSS